MGKQGQEKINLIIPAILLVLAIALSVVIYYVSDFYSSVVGPDEVEEITKPTSMNSKLSILEQKEALKVCSEKVTINQKDWCYLDIAKNNFVDSCENIAQDHFKNYCMAIIKSSSTYCDEIIQTSVKNACYIAVAQNTKNENLCKKTTREEYCLSLVA